MRPVGQVTEGMDVVNKIAETRTDWSDRPMQQQKMKKVTVDTFGESTVSRKRRDLNFKVLL